MRRLCEYKRQEVRVGAYKVLYKIGGGSFGDVYLGKSTINGDEVAIKVESLEASTPRLYHEYTIYRYLGLAPGIPRLRGFCHEPTYNALILELLGQSLGELFEYCQKQFTIKTVLQLLDQMLARLEHIHARGVLHRDIKPENFVMGRYRQTTTVYLCDFGLAKKFQDRKTQIHIPYRNNKNLTGTARYASINAHDRIEQSRRDDLISLAYVCGYFLRGQLPWVGLVAATKQQKYERILESKMATSSHILLKDFPNEFAIFLDYGYKLLFNEKPNYDMLRRMFSNCRKSLKLQFDTTFDWDSIKYFPLEVLKNRAIDLFTVPVACVRDDDDDAKSGELALIDEPGNRWL